MNITLYLMHIYRFLCVTGQPKYCANVAKLPIFWADSEC